MSAADAPTRSVQRRWAPSRVVSRVAFVLALAGISSLCRVVAAEGTDVPPELQVDLLSKLSTYDRNFAARAGDVVHWLIVVKAKSTRSDLSASNIKGALSQLDRFAGLPHSEVVATYGGAQALAKRCRDEHIAIVYVTPELEDEIGKIRASLVGLDILSVAADPDDVESGIVLGFELLSGKPKMLINYDQAKQQNVNFAADVLKLMKVVK